MHKSLKMAKDSSSLIRPRKCQGLNIRPRLFLIVFQIDHVLLTRLTSADCYRYHSLYCLAGVFQNLPASHKHYGVFDAFADFQSFFPTWKLRVVPQGIATPTLVKVAYV